jgi:hypothetical protein
MYTLAGDLIILATSAANSGDLKSAARLFLQACVTSDLPVLINKISSNKDVTASDTISSYNFINKKINKRFIVALTEELDNTTLFSKKEIMDAVRAIKSSDTSSNKDKYSFEIVDKEVCPEGCDETCDCNEDETQDEFDLDGAVIEDDDIEILASSSTSLEEDIKTALISLKLRSDDWDVKKFIPILMTIFPDLVIKGSSNREIRNIVNNIINRLKTLDKNKLNELHNAVKPLLTQE